MEQIWTYLEENKDILLEDVKNFLRIPSISTDSNYKNDVTKTAEFVANYLKDSGFKDVRIKETEGHPLVYAEWMEAGDAPTVLLYGHYDVQPPEPLEEWKSEPFEPEIRDGRLYARGSSDDKGQVFMHLAVLRAFLETEGKLPINVKVCIEGEEEIGSEHLYDILQKEKDLFEADLAVISDSGFVTNDQPTILYGLKGFTGLEFTLKGPDNDLHSGMYGGAIRNPAIAMAHLLATMKDEDEVIQIKGFYDDVIPLEKTERELMAKAPSEDFTKTTGAPETVSEKGDRKSVV